MSDQSCKIKKLKEKFRELKSAIRCENGEVIDFNLGGDIYSSLMDVGEQKIYELKDELYQLIYDPSEGIRELAVQILGSCNYLKVKEFRDIAYKIWLNDSSESVQYAALSVWGGYYRESYDPIVLNYLYNIFKPNKYSLDIRSIALYRFIDVVDAFSCPSEKVDILNLNELSEGDAFNKAVDWGKVTRIMQEYVFTRKDISQIKETKLTQSKKYEKIEFKRSTKVEDLRKVLIVAKDSPRDPNGYLKDEELGWEVYLTLCSAAEKPLPDLKEEIYAYLDDLCEEFRELAVKALGDFRGLHLEEFKDLAYKIFEEDPSEKVKFSALRAWVGYYKNTYNPSVLKRLYTVFQGEYKEDIRAVSLHGLLSVANAFKDQVESAEIYSLEGLRGYSDYIKSINSERVRKIMNQYAT